MTYIKLSTILFHHIKSCDAWTSSINRKQVVNKPVHQAIKQLLGPTQSNELIKVEMYSPKRLVITGPLGYFECEVYSNAI